MASLPTAAGLAYREAVPEGDPEGVVLLVHGYPESSFMWRGVLEPIARAGWRAIAPDLAGFGDSPPDRPGTWARHVEGLERFRRALGLEQVVLVVHDWGGLIGLRWACDHPDAVRGLVISDSGFFPDGRWHGLADALRTPGTGEDLVAQMTPESFSLMLAQVSRGIDEHAAREYFKAAADPDRRAAQLELYRSGEFSELVAYDGRLAALGVPVLLLWGEDDAFAPVAGAHRFARELGERCDVRLVVVEGAGHFVYEDDPERCAAEIAGWLAAARP